MPRSGFVRNKTFADAKISMTVKMTISEKSVCKSCTLCLIVKFSLEYVLNDVNFFSL